MSSDATVRVNYEQTEVYEQFVDEYSVFSSYQDFFVFAAAVGYARNKHDDPGSGNEMLWMHFTNKTLYKATAAAIAYNHLKTPEALIDPEKQLDTLARFQAGGVKILEEEFGDIEGDPTNALLNYIQDERSEEDDEGTQTVIEQIVQSFDDDMYTYDE
jgi:hypothetical protein